MDHSYSRRWSSGSPRPLKFFVLIFLLFAATAVRANPEIVVDASTGQVLYEHEATRPWYPASLTKLMTIYVALSAVRDHQISLDTPLVVSHYAATMPPSKMGFAPGTEVTLGNALKMLVVKSANDIAVTVAEGIAGSVDAFAEDMNRTASELGMSESHFVNPNGLHDPDHVSSARDLAVLARALFVNFPDAASLFSIGELRLGDELIPTHNDLLGRYPGADGMKTGFTSSAGFNLVASATRGGHRYIAVVLGAPSIKTRLVRIAVLLDRAFAGIDRPRAFPDLEPASGSAPDMHDAVCRRRAKTIAEWDAETEQLEAPLATAGLSASPANGFLFNAAPSGDTAPAASRIALMAAPVFDPVSVYIGPAPGYQGPVAEARPPHSPIGTQAPPPAVSSYTDEKSPQGLEAVSPVKPDAAALPMKGRIAKKNATKVAQKPAKGAKLANHEPTPQIEEDADLSNSEPPAKHVAKSKHSKLAEHAAKAKHVTKASSVPEKKKVAAAEPHNKTKHKISAQDAKPHKAAKAKSGKVAGKKKPAKVAAPQVKPASAAE